MRALAAGLALLASLAGCGTFELPPTGDAGRACVADSECVPDGCCGRGSGAVHVLDGPDCGLIDCAPDCPASQVSCGCGLPVCRDARCTVAWSADPACE